MPLTVTSNTPWSCVKVKKMSSSATSNKNRHLRIFVEFKNICEGCVTVITIFGEKFAKREFSLGVPVAPSTLETDKHKFVSFEIRTDCDPEMPVKVDRKGATQGLHCRSCPFKRQQPTKNEQQLDWKQPQTPMTKIQSKLHWSENPTVETKAQEFPATVSKMGTSRTGLKHVSKFLQMHPRMGCHLCSTKNCSATNESTTILDLTAFLKAFKELQGKGPVNSCKDSCVCGL